MSTTPDNQPVVDVEFLEKPVKSIAKDSTPSEKIQYREQRVREEFVALEELNRLREAVATCYKKEGVNHIEKCQEVVAAYKERAKLFPRFGALE